IAPYEIFSNNVLTFDEIIRIKQAEDVLEKYWNDHRMDYTIEYLVTEVFETPFDFFQNFGTYWEEKGWSRIGHQLEDLFKRLEEFLSTVSNVNMKIVRSLMQLDYLSKQQFQPRKLWWEERVNREKQKAIYNLLKDSPTIAGEDFTQFELSEKEFFKHSLLIPFAIDFNAFEEGNIVPKEGTLLTYFRQGQTPYFATIYNA
ncbi:DUF4080 domain-containing protein, partial [Butyricicoccus sp. 1XD8-22]